MILEKPFRKLAGNWSKNTGALWLTGFFIYQNTGVVVEADVRTVLAANFFAGTHDNRVDLIAFFYLAFWGSLFNGAGHNVANPGKTPGIFSVHRKHTNDASTGVIGNF